MLTKNKGSNELGLLDHQTVCTPNNRSTLLYLLLIMYTYIYMWTCMYTYVHIHLDAHIHAYTHKKIAYAYAHASMHMYTYFPSPNWYQFQERKTYLQEVRCRAHGPDKLWTKLGAEDYNFQRYRLGHGFGYKAKSDRVSRKRV